MKKEDKFYLVIVLAVIAVRLIVFLYPKHLIINGILIHHFWTGVLLILITLLFFRKYKNFNFIILGIGLGYVIDELGFLVLGGWDFPEYWALPSILSVIFFLSLIYLFKEKIYKTTFK